MTNKLQKFRIDGIFAGGVTGTREDGREGNLTPAREGQPLQAGEELVQVAGSSEPGTVQLRTVYKHHGPPRASTKAFRTGYDAIFGEKAN